jgi:molybdopterin/thiamine biosynthesis adenylyltransferase
MRRWTDVFPQRLQAEVEAFEHAEGLDFALDETEMTASGRVVFRGTLTLSGRDPILLEVRYPDSFPYLRPEVFAPELRLGRHQNPYRHNLCLLERSTRQWSPGNTGAWLVAERTPKLLALLEGDPEQMRREEAPQGEPASYYFRAQAGTIVLLPEEALDLPDDLLAGTMRLAIAADEDPGSMLRAGLIRVEACDNRGKSRPVAEAGGPFAEHFSKTVYEGRWVRLPSFPQLGGDAEHLFAGAREVPGFQEPPRQGVAGANLRILGVVCKEEVRQGEYEDTWLFAVEMATVQLTRQGKTKRVQHYIARGDRLSAADLAERIPSLAGLQGKTVALVGLGALGAPLSIELARAQVGELRMLDHDVVEAGTIVRWPFGLGAVGYRKTAVLSGFIGSDYPYTRVRTFEQPIGLVPASADEAPAQSEAEMLSEFLDGVDLVIDATAEIGVQQLLAALADEAGIPQVFVSATEGGWGGIVARVVPGLTGCWYCLQKRIADKSIVAPPQAETGMLQPRGCSAPTWTGTSFDALPLIAQATRTATFTLLGGRHAAHPADVFVCAQRADTAADLGAPEWTQYALEPHVECEACAIRQAA